VFGDNLHVLLQKAYSVILFVQLLSICFTWQTP